METRISFPQAGHRNLKYTINFPASVVELAIKKFSDLLYLIVQDPTFKKESYLIPKKKECCTETPRRI
jgi:hypothetical protein